MDAKLVKWAKLTGLAIVIAVAVWFIFQPMDAKAADLGGNCCADLEERIADLEATTARKGNTKVKLQVYGQISEGLLFWDADDESDVAVQSNSAAESFVGFSGEGRINGDAKAGFILEIGTGGYEYGVGIVGDTRSIYTRTAAVYVESATLGRVTLGQYSQATDSIAEISVANTAVAARMLSLRPLTGPPVGEVADLFDGSRGNVIRYDSPSLAGFRASASWAPGAFDTDVFDVALRFATEAGGFAIAAGVGYREGITVPTIGIIGGSDAVHVLSGSASVKHLTTGLFLSAAAGSLEVDGVDFELRGYHGQAGIERKWISWGATTLFVEAARAEIDGVDGSLDLIGAGVVQSIDSAALDLFLNARQYEIGDEDVIVGMAGARIRF
jgi:hypothetical protein